MSNHPQPTNPSTTKPLYPYRNMFTPSQQMKFRMAVYDRRNSIVAHRLSTTKAGEWGVIVETTTEKIMAVFGQSDRSKAEAEQFHASIKPLQEFDEARKALVASINWDRLVEEEPDGGLRLRLRLPNEQWNLLKPYFQYRSSEWLEDADDFQSRPGWYLMTWNGWTVEKLQTLLAS